MAKKKQSMFSMVILLIAAVFILANRLFNLTGLFQADNKASHGFEPGSTQNTVDVHFIDVGQGDAIYIRTPSQNILIDAGEKSNTVADYLSDLKVGKLDLIISTHGHSDHIGGLINVLEKFDADEVIDPGIAHTSKTYEKYLTLIDEKNVKFTEGRAGMKRTLGDGTVLEIFSPVSPKEGNLNETSVVTKLTYKGVSFLFTGDAQIGSEKEMLANGYNLDSDILKVGHHGSTSSSGEKFLDAVSPEAAVIMCGEGNSYGHPHKETLDKLDERKVNVYRTDINGNIIISTDGHKYSVFTGK